MKEIAVVLLSGGMDSTTAMAIAAKEFKKLKPLFIDYGQRHIAEWDAACFQAVRFTGVVPFKLDIPTPFAQDCSLLDRELDIDTENGKWPNSFVPMRNMLFLTYAFGFAHMLGASTIVLGTNTVDYSGYPDCRVSALEAVTTAADQCLGNDLIRKTSRSSTPSIGLSIPISEWGKDRIIQEGIALGVDYSKTVTCYDADDKGRACGKCPACVIRRDGFKKPVSRMLQSIDRRCNERTKDAASGHR